MGNYWATTGSGTVNLTLTFKRYWTYYFVLFAKSFCFNGACGCPLEPACYEFFKSQSGEAHNFAKLAFALRYIQRLNA